jgi:hypothetical protein
LSIDAHRIELIGVSVDWIMVAPGQSLYGIAARIHTRTKRSLECVYSFLVFCLQLLGCLLLLCRSLCDGLLLGLGIRLSLCHASFHGAGDCSRTSARSRITGDCTDGCSAPGTARRASHAAALYLFGVICGLLLGRRDFFRTRALWGWRLGVNARSLFG